MSYWQQFNPVGKTRNIFESVTQEFLNNWFTFLTINQFQRTTIKHVQRNQEFYNDNIISLDFDGELEIPRIMFVQLRCGKNLTKHNLFQNTLKVLKQNNFLVFKELKKAFFVSIFTQ